jgi:hypothetical protein
MNILLWRLNSFPDRQKYEGKLAPIHPNALSNCVISYQLSALLAKSKTAMQGHRNGMIKNPSTMMVDFTK